MDNFYRFVYGIEWFYIPNKRKDVVKEQMPSSNNTVSINTDKDILSLMKKLEDEVLSCKKCNLSLNRNNVVFGEGSLNAKLMFIGEGPGYMEDKKGRPFVGRAGLLLDKMIKAMGYKREEVYIANIVKCRPPNNRVPTKDEAAMCLPYLIKQIGHIKPEVIICLGSSAANYLLNINMSITKIRGSIRELKLKINNSNLKIKVIPTYHPAYLLRNPNKKAESWQDLQKAMSILKDL
ncbi:MAG: uracil-DNA glycosylase [Deferribacterota bacterium]|nr:uracil-DNA glycosylase [Deferribacterota bacterium]